MRSVRMACTTQTTRSPSPTRPSEPKPPKPNIDPSPTRRRSRIRLSSVSKRLLLEFSGGAFAPVRHLVASLPLRSPGLARGCKRGFVPAVEHEHHPREGLCLTGRRCTANEKEDLSPVWISVLQRDEDRLALGAAITLLRMRKKGVFRKGPEKIVDRIRPLG